MALEPGMRVLDMGAGRAVSSIFLAAEYGVEVWANDLWISATDNWARIRAAGMEGKVHPIHAEAHDLPYAEGFFDAILSMDSYQYYGTDDLYLRRFSAFVRPGGRIGIAVPGMHRDFDGPVPEYLTRKQRSGNVFWDADCWCFHTAAVVAGPVVALPVRRAGALRCDAGRRGAVAAVGAGAPAVARPQGVPLGPREPRG